MLPIRNQPTDSLAEFKGMRLVPVSATRSSFTSRARARPASVPTVLLRPKHIEAFALSLKTKLLNNDGFAKAYLRLLVDEIRVVKREVTMRGSYAAVAQAVETKTGIPNGVPRFVPS